MNPPRTRTLIMQEPTHHRRKRAMPESIINAAAPIVADHFTGLMQSIPAWFKAIVGFMSSLVVGSIGYLFKGQNDLSKEVNDIKQTCGGKHMSIYTQLESRIDRVEDNLTAEMNKGFENVGKLVEVQYKSLIDRVDAMK